MNEVISMNRKEKMALVALLSIAIVIPYSYIAYTATLKTKNYNSRIIVGEGNLPDLDFGFFTANLTTEVTEFNYSGLMPQSTTEFTYILHQKTSFDLDVYVRWGYSILPISYLNLEMQWNGTAWPYTDYKVWHTTEDVPITFKILVGEVDNTEWDFYQIFTVSTTP